MDQDCRDIANGHCSNDHTCDCQENYGQLNETACKPILGGPCLIDGDCIVDNSHCLYKKCQCKPNFLSILNEKCVACKYSPYRCHKGEYEHFFFFGNRRIYFLKL